MQGGVRVAVTDVTGDGGVDLLTGAGPGAPAFVRVFATSAGDEAARGFVFDPPSPATRSWPASEPDRRVSIPGAGTPRFVRVFSASVGGSGQRPVFDASFTGGAFVGGE